LKNRIIAVLHANNFRQQFLFLSHKTNFPKQKTSIYYSSSSSASQFLSFFLSFTLRFFLPSHSHCTEERTRVENQIVASLSVFSCRSDRCKKPFLFFFFFFFFFVVVVVVVAQRANKQACAPQMLLLLLPDALNR
jgi:hypothetical protein